MSAIAAGKVQRVAVPNLFYLGDREIEEVDAGVVSDLFPDSLGGCDREDVAAFYEGVNIPRCDWDSTRCDGGTLGFIVRPEGIGALGAGIWAAIQAEAAAMVVWASISTAVGTLVAAFLVGRIAMALLMPKEQEQVERGSTKSSVYSFSGISNTRSEGLPLPLIFGEIRFGGTLINEYLRSGGIPEVSTLYQQLSLGEGPIHSISGIEVDTPGAQPIGTEFGTVPASLQVDGNSAENYDDMLMWVRLGTNEQLVVPGFEATRVFVSANLGLGALEVSGTNNAGPTSGPSGLYLPSAWDDTTNDHVWAAHGVALDLGLTEIDAAILRMYFERGLFTQNNTTGDLESSNYAFQVRYRELDSTGTPIATGGHTSDGWVRLPPVGPIATTSPQPFTIESHLEFYDPQTWAPPVRGKCLRGEARATALEGETGFTSSFWFKPAAGLLADASLLSLTDLQVHADGSISINNYGPYPEPGSRIYTAPGMILTDTWNHIMISAWRWADSAHGPFSLFLNGAEIIHISDTAGLGDGAGWANASVQHIGDVANAPNTLFDQFTIYNEPLGHVAATIEFNGGLGREEYFPNGWGSQGDSRLFSAVTFNDTGGAQSAPNPRFTDWVPYLGSQSGIDTGVVPDSSVPTTNVHKRSRYRIEVLRTNVDSTSTRVADDLIFAAALAVTNIELTYPHTPILALKVGATEQLNGSAPTTTSVVKGLLVPVWDGASTTTPSVSLEWSSNPAWITLGLLTNGRWGMGQTYIVQNCVSQSLLDWANYCDELVYNGSAQFNYDTPTGISEDVLFDTDPTNPDDRGVIQFNIRKTSTGSALPLDWVVGAKLRAHGFPIPNVTDINQGALNSGAAGGYEIFGIQEASLSGNDYWAIKCYWDRLDEADPWTPGPTAWLSAIATILITATIELGEKRHEFNGVFDREQGAWDSILEVCQVGRAIPIREGSKVRFKFQHPRTPAGLITSANIVGGSFSVGYSNPRMKPNAVDITILDRAQQYNLVPITVLDSAIENVLNLSEVRKVSRNYLGITSAAQAERQARFELNINRLIKRGGSFTLGPSGLPFEAGDLVRLGADIMPRGDGGRVLRTSHPGGYKQEMISDPTDFTAWTASGVTVTADTVANPFGTTDADKVQDSVGSHGYVQATGTVSGSDLNAEWVSFGVYIKPGVISSNKTIVALILDGGAASYFCDWATETIYASQFATLPEDLRSAHMQKLGTSGWYFVQVAGFHETRTSAAAAPIVRIFPASNTASAGAATGIIEAFNGRMSYGQWASPGGSGISGRITMIDRDLTLADGVHKVYGRNVSDNAAEGTLDSTLCPAGAYTAGDILITSAVMGTSLQEESSWMVVKSGDELVVEIMTSTLMQDFTRECEWIEYQEDIYNDTADPTSTSPLLGFGSSGDSRPSLDLAVTEDSPPGNTAITGAMDVLVRQAPGQFVTTVYLGLDYAQPTRRLVSRTEIFWRVVGQNAADWNLAGGTTGLNPNAIVQIPNAQPGQIIELTANSITQRGRRRKPGSSLRVQVPLRGLTAPPETPTALSAELSQRQAVYGYAVTGEDLLAVEIRRGGGWILGQPVYREAASQRAGTRSSEPTSNWAGSTTGTPTLRYAAQNAAGAYGVPATTTWSPTPDADRLPSDVTAPDQAWESWEPGGNGWESAVPAPGEPFIGPEFEQATGGSLGYTSASTSVAWETVYTSQRDSGAALTLEQDRQPRAAFLEAWVDAEASTHITWDAATWEISDMLEDRWTWEGPRYTTPGETANPELVIEVRINVDGTTAGWGSWQEYKPGIYRIVDAQFRLRARRHDTGQNIIVAKLHTRITPPRLSLEETTPAQSLLHGETF